MQLFSNRFILGAAAAMALGLMTVPAQAATSVMKECSAQYKADKAAGKVKEGETWTKYYSACAKAKKAEKPAAGKTATSAAKSSKPLTAAQKATHARIKECGAMWRKEKAAGKIAKGDTWPKYWHRCNDKLKKG